jgi:hypothetical protein
MEAKLKHLEFLQAVISRMATNSFLFKGWAITIAAALASFAAVDNKPGLMVIAIVSTLMFWMLDGYYLWLERCFRKLYDSVAGIADGQVTTFSMLIDKSHPVKGVKTACARLHLLIFYGAIIAVDIVGIIVIKGASSGPTCLFQL